MNKKLTDLDEFIIDIGDNRTVYYMANKVIKALGFKNVSQTLQMYCRYAQDTYNEDYDRLGTLRRLKIKVIPEADVLALIDKTNNVKTKTNISSGQTVYTIEYYSEEIEKLEKTKSMKSEEDIALIMEEHQQEVEKLKLEHEKNKEVGRTSILLEASNKKENIIKKAELEAQEIMDDAKIKAEQLIEYASQKATRHKSIAVQKADLAFKEDSDTSVFDIQTEYSYKQKINALDFKLQYDLREAKQQQEITKKIEKLEIKKKFLQFHAGKTGIKV